MKKQHKKTARNLSLAAVLALAFLPGTRNFARQSSQPNTGPAQQNQAPAQSKGPAQNQPQTQPPAQGQPAPSLRNPQVVLPPQPPAISPQETQAYQAIQKELDPDKQVQLVQVFEKQFPKSLLLSDVYFMGAGAEERKNDVPDAVSFCKASLKLRPDNLRSLILVSDLLPLPQALQGTMDQKEQQLTDAENDANHALSLLASVQPTPNVPENQFEQERSIINSQIHSGLGMVHLQRAILAKGSAEVTELTAAEQEYKSAVASPQPNPEDYFRLGEVYRNENKLDAAITAFTKAAQLGQGSMIQKFADNMVAQLKAEEAKTPPASQPVPPPKQ